jgi:uncharacterized protein YaaN involved in tellurite resistance
MSPRPLSCPERDALTRETETIVMRLLELNTRLLETLKAGNRERAENLDSEIAAAHVAREAVMRRLHEHVRQHNC